MISNLLNKHSFTGGYVQLLAFKLIVKIDGIILKWCASLGILFGEGLSTQFKLDLC